MIRVYNYIVYNYNLPNTISILWPPERTSWILNSTICRVYNFILLQNCGCKEKYIFLKIKTLTQIICNLELFFVIWLYQLPVKQTLFPFQSFNSRYFLRDLDNSFVVSMLVTNCKVLDEYVFFSQFNPEISPVFLSTSK